MLSVVKKKFSVLWEKRTEKLGMREMNIDVGQVKRKEVEHAGQRDGGWEALGLGSGSPGREGEAEDG